MRHAVRGRKLARTTSHRLALRRNLVQSLIEHGKITTTIQKAKEVRAFAEKLVTLAITGDRSARQRAEALLTDRSIIPAAHRAEYDAMTDAKRERVLRTRSGRRYRHSAPGKGAPFTAESVIHKLFAEVGPRMKQRNETRGAAGGYTRLIKLPNRRLGDGGEQAVLQWVAPDDVKRPRLSAKTERRRKATVRYAAYAGKKAPRRAAARKPKGAAPTA
ncbi:MAG: 50S ribosomal protein L17 [Planctomycetia bacterium]|nr:MAG: 50S ribosomal protein L17 [Planctomycetia bacterium]